MNNAGGAEKPRTIILVCGLIATDIVFQLAEMPRKAEKYRADDATVNIGGGGAIASVALQKLGAQALLCGRLGMDQFGQQLISELEIRGVNCDRIQRLQNSRSSVSSIYIDQEGERQIVNYRGELDTTERNYKQLAAACVSQSDVFSAVQVDTRWPEAAIHALEAANRRQVPSVLDVEVPIDLTAMSLASHLAFSRQGLSDYAQTENIEIGLQKARKQFDGWVCVTDGENGVHFLENGDLHTVRGLSVPVVDTLGAGDVWHAAFTFQLAREIPERAAIAFANAAAALKCMKSGGGDAAPGLEQVEAMLHRAAS